MKDLWFKIGPHLMTFALLCICGALFVFFVHSAHKDGYEILTGNVQATKCMKRYGVEKYNAWEPDKIGIRTQCQILVCRIDENEIETRFQNDFFERYVDCKRLLEEK